jgi:hydrogenase maturation factor
VSVAAEDADRFLKLLAKEGFASASLIGEVLASDDALKPICIG